MTSLNLTQELKPEIPTSDCSSSSYKNLDN